MSDVQFEDSFPSYSRNVRNGGSSPASGGSILAFMMKTGRFKDVRQANIALIVVAGILLAVMIGVFLATFGFSGSRQLTREEADVIIDRRISDKAPLDVQDRRRKRIEETIFKK